MWEVSIPQAGNQPFRLVLSACKHSFSHCFNPASGQSAIPTLIYPQFRGWTTPCFNPASGQSAIPTEAVSTHATPKRWFQSRKRAISHSDKGTSFAKFCIFFCFNPASGQSAIPTLDTKHHLFGNFSSFNPASGQSAIPTATIAGASIRPKIGFNPASGQSAIPTQSRSRYALYLFEFQSRKRAISHSD